VTKFLVSYDDVTQTLPPVVETKLSATYTPLTASAQTVTDERVRDATLFAPIGAETTTGAQAKATAAENSAKTYAGTLAYGTTLAATDATVAGFVNDTATAAGGALNTKYDRWSQAAMTATTDLNAVTTPGTRIISLTITDWAGQHFPANSRGLLTVTPINGTSFVQQYTTWDISPKSYNRSCTSNVWSPWVQVGGVGELLTATTDFNTVTSPGRYSLAANPTDWAGQNLPVNVRGVLTTEMVSTTSSIQRYTTYEATPRLFARQRASGIWAAWTQIGAIPTITPTADIPGSGMKRVGVPITAGHAGLDAALDATVRMPILLGAPVIRWRLRIQDINPRSGVTRGGAVNVSAIWFGTHSGAGAIGNQVQLASAFTIPDAATEYRTPWFNTPMVAGTEYLLSFGYTKATAPWAMLGLSYQTTSNANAGASNPPGMTVGGTAPFTIAIEAETYATVPVIASFGDSNSVGVGTANSLHDSWLNQLCRRLKALPDHRGSSGDTMLGSQSASYKYTRFDGLTKPDCVLWALGQNDAAVADQTLATMQSLLTPAAILARTYIAATLYLVNLTPRTSSPWAGFQALRQAYNTWLLTQPGEGRDVFNVAAAISSDDATIAPAYDYDGTHLNAAGCAQVQLSFTRPISTPALTY